MGVCQASPPQQPCEVGCVVLSYKRGTEGSREEVTCLVTQQGTQELGFKLKSVELQSPRVFSKEETISSPF